MSGRARPHVPVTGASWATAVPPRSRPATPRAGRATAKSSPSTEPRGPCDSLQRPRASDGGPFPAVFPAVPGESDRTSVATGRLRLETRRLTLRPLCDDDLDEMFLLLGDGDALALWGVPLDRGGARRWIKRNMTRYQADGFGRCAVVLRATGQLVGDCGLAPATVEGVPEVELGWIVRRAHWGKGIATEAAQAWRDYAFTELGLDRIVSMISEQNVASRRVAEKLGMTVERAAVWNGLPMLTYACVRSLARQSRRGRADQ